MGVNTMLQAQPCSRGLPLGQSALSAANTNYHSLHSNCRPSRNCRRSRSILTRAVAEPAVLPFRQDAKHLQQWHPEVFAGCLERLVRAQGLCTVKGFNDLSPPERPYCAFHGCQLLKQTSCSDIFVRRQPAESCYADRQVLLQSWREYKVHQQPEYPDQQIVSQAANELSQMPPLVFAGECRNLQSRLAKCATGESFWLQGAVQADGIESVHPNDQCVLPLGQKIS